MNLNAVAAAAAILVAGAPALASAQTTSPVAITGAQIVPQNIGAALYQQGEVRFSFVNNRNVPATEVDFTLSSAGQDLGTYYDYGTFSKGVNIDHFFVTDETAHNQQIKIASVKFADGTTWTNEPAAPQQLRQSVSVR